MELRDISPDDLPLWERLQCDPLMMAELGGPQPRERMPLILRNQINFVQTGRGWVFKVMSDADPEIPAGSVCIWESDYNDEAINEMGWMILTEFQGQGLGSRAARAILDKARAEGRWDVVHAFPGVSNAASNGICRKIGFTQLEACDVDYSGRILRCNHWVIGLRADPA